MQLTTEHAMSSYGMPVFVDDSGHTLDYADGIRRLRKQFGWSAKDLAERCGVSPRTVEGWEQGRLPSKPALMVMIQILES